MIKLRSIKNLSKRRNFPHDTIYNLIGVQDNRIKNYVGYTANISKRLKSHRLDRSKNFFQQKFSFCSPQWEVCQGMTPVDENGKEAPSRGLIFHFACVSLNQYLLLSIKLIGLSPTSHIPFAIGQTS